MTSVLRKAAAGFVLLGAGLTIAGGGEHPSNPAQATAPASVPSQVAAGAPERPCQVMTRRLARSFLGGPVQKPRVIRYRGNLGSCTYLTRDLKRSATIGLYDASQYERTARVIPRAKHGRLLGRKATFSTRLGYLIKVPNRPYYVQATYFHVEHLHADRRLSKRLAATVLTNARAPNGTFICSLTRNRKA